MNSTFRTRVLSAVLLLAALSLAACGKPATQTQAPPPSNEESSATTGTSAATTTPYSRYDLVFAVAGDSRSDTSWMTPGTTADYASYVSTIGLAALRGDLADWAGSPGFFLMHVGDLGYRGGTPVAEAFKNALMPSDAATRFPVYVAKGNHEIKYYKVKKVTDSQNYDNGLKAQKEYQSAMAGWIPRVESFTANYADLAYTFRTQDASTAIVVLDAYYVSTKDKKVHNGFYSDPQLAWLKSTLDGYKVAGVTNVFVTSHQPAFWPKASDAKYNKSHPTNVSGQGTLFDNYGYDYTNPKGTEYNAAARSSWMLWALLNTYDVDAFFCGHTHFYQRFNVVGTQWGNAWGSGKGAKNWPALPSALSVLQPYKDKPGWKTTIPHVINGAAGTMALTTLPAATATPKSEVASKTPNFSIVYVKDDVITVEGYAYDAHDGSDQKTPVLMDKYQRTSEGWKNIEDLTPEKP